MLLDLLRFDLSCMHARKGVTDSMIVFLGGIAVLVVLAFVFVAVIGNAIDSVVEMMCLKIAEDESTFSKIAELGLNFFSGCGK